jgi:hypothetical protein
MKPILVISCALAVACVAFVTVRASAQSPAIIVNPQFVTFGMVGLGAGQTARLNAFALPVGGPIIAGAYCQVTFAFYDDSGNSLKTGTEKVAQGAAVNYDLAWTDITTSTDRVEIRGTVRAALVTPSAVGTPVTPVTPVPASSTSCSVLPTLEIFGPSSGQTTVVLQQTTTLPLVTPL